MEETTWGIYGDTYNETCLEPNRKRLTIFFRCMQVPFSTGTLSVGSLGLQILGNVNVFR